jgi:hypothetical protein
LKNGLLAKKKGKKLFAGYSQRDVAGKTVASLSSFWVGMSRLQEALGAKPKGCIYF